METKKFLSLERLTEYDTLIKQKIDEGLNSKSDLGHTHTWAQLENKPFGSGLVTEQVADLRLQDGDEWKNTFINTVIPECSSYQTIVDTDYDSYIARWDGETLYFGDYYIANNDGEVTTNYNDVALYISKKVHKMTQLHEVYIPNTIARTYYVDNHIADTNNPHNTSWENLIDKPFGASTELVAEIQDLNISTTERSDWYEYAINDMNLLGDVSTYHVDFDYVGYECELNSSHIEDNEAYAYSIGNKNIVDSTAEDTGEPFYIYERYLEGDAYSTYYVCTREAGTHTISMYKEGSVVIPISEEYIPDTIARTIDMDNKLGDKANVSDIPTGALAHKDIVSESDLDYELAEKINAASEGNHSHSNKDVLDGITSEKVSSWDSSLDLAKEYTDNKTNGMATTTVVDTKISTHNTATDAHNDIRDLITGLTTRLNTLADSDDTTLDQMSELVAYIKSNKELIDGITTTKVNVADIVDNLTTNANNKPLSAAQGVAIKALIDALQIAVDGKADGGHKHVISDVTDLQAALNAKASQESFDNHVADTTKHITSTERTNWNAAKTHADSAHAPSNAQENVIESIKVNGTAQAISSKSVNIVVPTDNASLTNGAGYLVASDIANKADKSTTLAGYGISNAYTKDEVDAKTVVDSALSASSTNPVQNKAVNSAISTLTSTVSANTSSIGSHTTAISNLQTAVDAIQEITSEEIQALFNN